MQVSISACRRTAPCIVLKDVQSPSFWVTLLVYVGVFPMMIQYVSNQASLNQSSQLAYFTY